MTMSLLCSSERCSSRAAFDLTTRSGTQRPAQPVRRSGLLCVASAFPTARVPRAMKDCVDNDLRPFHLEEDGIREAPQEGAAHLTVHELVRLRMASDRRDT